MQPSKRTLETISSPVGEIVHLLNNEVSNMAQGMVYWGPPASVFNESVKYVNDNPSSFNLYGSTSGLSYFKEALLNKVKVENGIEGNDIIVTPGANQAILNAVMATCSSGDSMMIFSPYYFNLYMSLQLCNVNPVIVEITADSNGFVELDVDSLPFSSKIKAVQITSPSNPSGYIITKKSIQALQKKCEELGIWLISDEAYEYFTYGVEHYSPVGPNVINIFSFSKSFGIAGWRVGYMVFPKSLKVSLDKIQDTAPIHASRFSQHIAYLCLKEGSDFVKKQVKELEKNREVVWEAIKSFPGAIRSSGAIYFFVKLPEGTNEMEIIEYLAKTWKVLVLPGNASGKPGHIRISYSNLKLEDCVIAAKKLKDGLDTLIPKNKL